MQEEEIGDSSFFCSLLPHPVFCCVVVALSEYHLSPRSFPSHPATDKVTGKQADATSCKMPYPLNAFIPVDLIPPLITSSDRLHQRHRETHSLLLASTNNKSSYD
jgi:hypothetical protein